ncbi:bifunctional helix-turn-helix transcriptional regulator/GNAT family N-acetyltransferase [candidate division KSB1 bacterium]|nr:bifunctional helix-turn-helix transcriptional regulator/GNAT family N-acetyltransferase [candidate division KSB1 bacterium]
MDLIDTLGYLAVGSRLRRLSDRFMRDAARAYESQELDFEPRWFPVYYLVLKAQQPITVTEIAKRLGVTHPAVVQIVKDMSREGVILTDEGKADRRQRLVTLSEKGRRMAPPLEILWDDIRQATVELVRETDLDLIAVSETLEAALAKRGVFERVQERVKARQLDAVRIVDYRPTFRALFRTLNEEWLRKFFVLEPHDVEMLSDPEGCIIARGGVVLFAELEGEILGTCALLPHAPHVFELAKMAVTERAQGKQIGRKLALAAIERARTLQANAVILESSTKLGPALALYEKLGFRHVPRERPSAYARADVFMRLELDGSARRAEGSAPHAKPAN